MVSLPHVRANLLRNFFVPLYWSKDMHITTDWILFCVYTDTTQHNMARPMLVEIFQQAQTSYGFELGKICWN